MRRLITFSLLFGFLLTAACGDKKKQPAAEEEEAVVATCEANTDCGDGEVCLAGECASTAPGAVYADPGTAVTPEKVKSQLDAINEKAQKRNDEILDGL